MEARKTEYKGVVFRSKSEAILARTFDLCKYRWVYEPFRYGGHAWDFYLEVVNSDDCTGFKVDDEDRDDGWSWEPLEVTTVMRWLVEYKPIEPTSSYVDGLRRCLRKGAERGSNSPINGGLLITGSPYSPREFDEVPEWGVCSYWVSHIDWDTAKVKFAGDAMPAGWIYGRGWCGGFGGAAIDLPEKHAQAAKKYRFDLRQPA